jgi:hypothetical protein
MNTDNYTDHSEGRNVPFAFPASGIFVQQHTSGVLFRQEQQIYQRHRLVCF